MAAELEDDGPVADQRREFDRIAFEVAQREGRRWGADRGGGGRDLGSMRGRLNGNAQLVLEGAKGRFDLRIGTCR